MSEAKRSSADTSKLTGIQSACARLTVVFQAYPYIFRIVISIPVDARHADSLLDSRLSASHCRRVLERMGWGS